MIKDFLVEQDALRLDRFLAQQISDLSRTKIQKDIEAGKVSVNGQIILEPKFNVGQNDRVEYNFIVEDEKSVPDDLPLAVVYENDDLLIIDKPPGLVVHPAPGFKGPTVAQTLLSRYKNIHLVGEDNARPGIVHRLDKDTSGLLLIAKTQLMFEHLKDAFATRKIKKEYIALVCGRVPNNHGFIELPIGRHSTDFRKMTSRQPKEGKAALTEYSVLEYLKGKVDEYTLLRVKLHTGRTHQIRVHLSSQGFPIAGDTLYGKCKIPGLSRQFLHAASIEVRLPDGSWIEARAALPKDLMDTLQIFQSTFRN